VTLGLRHSAKNDTQCWVLFMVIVPIKPIIISIVIMLNVIMLNVILLSVAAPCKSAIEIKEIIEIKF
jgi:hypothetical protein